METDNYNATTDRVQQFKRELSRVFDDNLHTKQWHNYVDYAIIGLIILSTVEVFRVISPFVFLVFFCKNICSCSEKQYFCSRLYD